MNIVNVGYRSTNYYVLANSTPKLLVDAGWPGTLGAMEHSCSRMTIRLADIPYQLVTHFHPDHAGLVQDLRHLGVQLIVLDVQLAIDHRQQPDPGQPGRRRCLQRARRGAGARATRARSVWVYNCRNIAQAASVQPPRASLHAYGLAVDIDPEWSPIGTMSAGR